jgi:hypothetical protein
MRDTDIVITIYFPASYANGWDKACPLKRFQNLISLQVNGLKITA